MKKNIEGFTGYTINERGEVFSHKRVRPVKMTHQENADGYYVINLISDEDGKSYHRRINRLVAIAFLPNPENYCTVHHKDNDMKNNHVSNLEWCTQDQNIQYKVDSERQATGEKHGNSKLKEGQVLEIYSKLLNKTPLLHLAKEYGVHPRTIGRIRDKLVWKKLLNELPCISL